MVDDLRHKHQQVIIVRDTGSRLSVMRMQHFRHNEMFITLNYKDSKILSPILEQKRSR